MSEMRRRPVTDSSGKELEGNSTPDSVFDMFLEQKERAYRTYEQSEKNLIEFVERQISLMNQNVLFGGADPSLYELNRVLSQYETVALGLTSLYATVRQEKDYAQEKYDDAYALWFVEKRTALTSLGDKKMPSTREIDMMVRSDHLEDLARLKAACIEAETKRSFVERLCKGWSDYSFILNTMSRNAQAEVGYSLRSSENLPSDKLD